MARLELRRGENVVLQQMEQDDMSSDNGSDQRVAPEREQPEDVRPSTRPSPQSGPPVFNDGLESPRSGHC
jgi:hypothetical protein